MDTAIAQSDNEKKCSYLSIAMIFETSCWYLPKKVESFFVTTACEQALGLGGGLGSYHNRGFASLQIQDGSVLSLVSGDNGLNIETAWKRVLKLQGILASVKTGHNDDIKSTIDLLLIWWYSSDLVHHKFTEITNAIAFFFC